MHRLSICVLFLSSLSYNLFSQIHCKGTYLFAGICKDGIVIAADSRVAFFPDDRLLPSTAFAYFDRVQKLWPLKRIALCTAGPSMFNDRFMEYYIEQFRKTILNDSTGVYALQAFLNFIKYNFPNQYSQFLKLKIITAGYTDGKPGLYAYHDGKIDYLIGGGAFIESDNTFDFGKYYREKYTCKKMARILVRKIGARAKQLNLTTTVGGPIMILRISPNNTFMWLKNPPSKPQRKVLTDLVDDYKSGKLKIQFTTEKDKNEFLNKFIQPNQNATSNK